MCVCMSWDIQEGDCLVNWDKEDDFEEIEARFCEMKKQVEIATIYNDILEYPLLYIKKDSLDLMCHITHTPHEYYCFLMEYAIRFYEKGLRYRYIEKLNKRLGKVKKKYRRKYTKKDLENSRKTLERIWRENGIKNSTMGV